MSEKRWPNTLSYRGHFLPLSINLTLSLHWHMTFPFTKATIRLLMLYIQKIQIRTMSYFMKTGGQTDRQWDITCSFQSQPQIPWRCLSAEEINFSNFLIPGLLTRCTLKFGSKHDHEAMIRENRKTETPLKSMSKN